jgi:hypothetical protein
MKKASVNHRGRENQKIRARDSKKRNNVAVYQQRLLDRDKAIAAREEIRKKLEVDLKAAA